MPRQPLTLHVQRLLKPVECFCACAFCGRSMTTVSVEMVYRQPNGKEERRSVCSTCLVTLQGLQFQVLALCREGFDPRLVIL